MTLNPPPFVKIGPVEYRVTLDPYEWSNKQNVDEAGTRYGVTDHQAATIYLNPAHQPTVTRLTLVHECLHAICSAELGAPDFDRLGDNTGEREERIARMFEAPLLALLRDNPDLVAFLTDGAP